MSEFRARLERNDIMGGGSGYTLRVHRKIVPGQYAELTDLPWVLIPEGDPCSHYLTDANTSGGSIVDFMRALMDAGWTQGLRPTILAKTDLEYERHIQSMQAHIDSLKRQVEMQDDVIKKLLSK